MPVDIYKYYTDDQWKEAIDYTTFFIHRNYKQVESIEDLDPSEWICAAIDKLATGKRKWNPNIHTLPQHLIHICRSDISHYLDKKKKFVTFQDEIFSDDSVASQEELLIDKETLVAIKNKVNESNDDLVSRLFQLYESGDVSSNKNADIANILNTEVSEIVNAKKRLKRIAVGVRGDS